MQSAKAPVLTAHGAKMPVIGYGTMELPHRPAELVAAAIAAGYRHIDTARKYGTEERVGEGIRAVASRASNYSSPPRSPSWTRARRIFFARRKRASRLSVSITSIFCWSIGHSPKCRLRKR